MTLQTQRRQPTEHSELLFVSFDRTKQTFNKKVNERLWLEVVIFFKFLKRK